MREHGADGPPRQERDGGYVRSGEPLRAPRLQIPPQRKVGEPQALPKREGLPETTVQAAALPEAYKRLLDGNNSEDGQPHPAGLV